MNTKQPEALRLADELCEAIAEYPDPTALEAQAAAELRRQHARITELESQLAQRFAAADSVLYDPKAVLDVFHSARAGSENPVGYMRGIRAVIAHWESRPEPHRWMVPAPAGAEESRTIPDREIPGIVEKALQELEGLVKYATSTYSHWDMRRAKGALCDLEWWARRKLAAHAQAADSVQEDAHALLQDVAACFTRDDDLPDNLLPRIDAVLADRKQGEKQ